RVLHSFFSSQYSFIYVLLSAIVPFVIIGFVRKRAFSIRQYLGTFLVLQSLIVVFFIGTLWVLRMVHFPTLTNELLPFNVFYFTPAVIDLSLLGAIVLSRLLLPVLIRKKVLQEPDILDREV